jgi:hypothetical protein
MCVYMYTALLLYACNCILYYNSCLMVFMGDAINAYVPDSLEHLLTT